MSEYLQKLRESFLKMTQASLGLCELDVIGYNDPVVQEALEFFPHLKEKFEKDNPKLVEDNKSTMLNDVKYDG